jgi:ubiquinone/menaquinone biosynthesis C-methylase UbiE
MATTWTLFDRLADRYDQILPFFASFAEQLIGNVAPSPGTRLLDVGTGRGAVASAAAARGCAVTAVDAAPRMVSLLSAAHPALDVRVMDIHRLDLPDDSYDLATGGFVIHLVADPGRVLAELHRVLRPGGTVALTVPGPYEDHGRWDGFREICDEFAQRSGPRPGPPDVPAELRAAGFTGVRAVGLEVHLPVTDPETCWNFFLSHGFAARVEVLGESDALEFRHRLLNELARMHDDGGIVLDRGATLHLAANSGR